MLVDVTTYYLEMRSPAELLPKRSVRPGISVVPVAPPLPELNRFFYTAIGGDWYWTDRLPWNYRDWQDYLEAPRVETWMLMVNGIPAGYAELDGRIQGEVELAYFGLLAPHIGKGLGSHLLTAAVERAFATGVPRVWVHTCTQDHPAALASYQARGFRLYRSETIREPLPPDPGPWPGAR